MLHLACLTVRNGLADMQRQSFQGMSMSGLIAALPTQKTMALARLCGLAEYREPGSHDQPEQLRREVGTSESFVPQWS